MRYSVHHVEQEFRGSSKEAEIRLKETVGGILEKEDKEESKEEQLWQNFVQNVAMS